MQSTLLHLYEYQYGLLGLFTIIVVDTADAEETALQWQRNTRRWETTRRRVGIRRHSRCPATRSRSKSKSPSDGSGLPRGTGRSIINLLTTAAVSLFGSSPPTATTDSSGLSNPLSRILPSNIPGYLSFPSPLLEMQ
eukprot:396377-Rhodomonas_salina.2